MSGYSEKNTPAEDPDALRADAGKPAADEEQGDRLRLDPDTERRLELAEREEEKLRREELLEEEIEAEEEAEEDSSVFLAGDLSVRHAVVSVERAMHLPHSVASYIVASLYLLVGLAIAVCTLVFDEIMEMGAVTLLLPYIVGGIMTVGGVVEFVMALRRREYLTVKTNVTVSSLFYAAIGVIIILNVALSGGDAEDGWAINFIGIIWGVYGLMEAAQLFNFAIARAAKKENCVYFIVKGVIETVLAVFLLFKPVEHLPLHVMVFGLWIMLDAITMMPGIDRRVHGWK